MAKKTDKKLALKRETLRSLSDNQLQAVAGGSVAYDADKYAAGGLKGPTSPPPGGDDPIIVRVSY